MVDLEFIKQLIDSMEDAVLRLEKAIESGDKEEENKLRVFIFDLHRKIRVSLETTGGELRAMGNNPRLRAVGGGKKKKKKAKKGRKRSGRKNA